MGYVFIPHNITDLNTQVKTAVDASFGSHGFLRAPDGAITTFDPPGAGTTGGRGTFPTSINPSGAITGHYRDATSVPFHGFLRAPDGTITTFDAPGAFQGTLLESINPAGAIAGFYGDARI